MSSIPSVTSVAKSPRTVKSSSRSGSIQAFRWTELSIYLALLCYEQDGNGMLLFIHRIDDTPITQSIAEVSNKGTSEPFDARMLVGILPQALETTV